MSKKIKRNARKNRKHNKQLQRRTERLRRQEERVLAAKGNKPAGDGKNVATDRTTGVSTGGANTRATVAVGKAQSGQVSIIFKSELDFISRCILDCPKIETGGQLFGYYTAEGVPVVLYAIGPGRNANHRDAFFNQDVEYLERIGGKLNRQFGLRHIGEWHSHHCLALASPSGHDASTMIGTIRSMGLGQFLLCIGNCRDGKTTLNPFPCTASDYSAGKWDVIFAESPVRSIVDRTLAGELEMPRTARACYRDPSLNPQPSSRPLYRAGYWLERKENNLVLNEMLSFLKRENAEAGVRIIFDGNSLVHIRRELCSRRGDKLEEDILFPMGFPAVAPEVRRWAGGRPVQTKASRWSCCGDILDSFKKYYSSL